MNAFAATLLTLFMACPALADGPPSYWEEDLSGIKAVAGSPAGAVATAKAGEKRTSAIRFKLSSDTSYRGLVIKGQVRSLLFVEDDAVLLAVVQKQKKGKAWDTYLLTIDTATTSTDRLLTLPRSAAGMTWWPGAKHILVACEHEIRSFTLPGFRSGPLYQLPGGNLALAHHSGPLFLVGRSLDLVLVNLEDSQAEDQIPVRQRFSLASPLRSMSVYSDPNRLYGVTLDNVKIEQPLDVLDISAAVLPLAPRPEPKLVQAPNPPPVPVVVEEPQVQPVETPEEPEPEPEPELEPVVEQPQARPVETPPAPEPVRQEAAPPPPPAPVRHTDYQVFGTIEGAAAAQVESVLVLGPNSILREATRVRPGDDGRWGIGSLAPGRYRLVLDGGGGHVIVSEPRFATIQVVEGEAQEVPPFDAQRVR
ncbi:MAG: hypothetical protein IFK94_04920 [Acidobacteria bacterium]|uniref:Carboxypeptidase regulatory-like domain-containing protein n=1 Tax=Candidatus Polarisedimenticola svalbardensis TaxID=2886004 RepID=A0A8J7CCI1_9BACT|nr:hypothetical protein [Candidatus Polarisedimenticola svalbardensis]